MANNPKNLRKCVACHQHDDKSKMLRVVKTKDGEFVVDRERKLDGRGAYVHNSEECLKKLQTKKVLNFAFKCKVDDDIYGKLKNE